MIGKVNLKIYDVNSKGGATMMVQKVSGEDFAHVNTLGMDIIKHLIDGVIEGKIEKKDIENYKRKRSEKINRIRSVNRSTENKKHLCDYCDKTFSTLQGLNVHKGHIHTEVKFLCDICKKRFESREEVKQHKQSVHTISESPNSKKMRMDSTVHKDRNKEHRTEDIELPMDIDNVEDPKYLQKRNDEKIMQKQKLVEQEEERIKPIKIHDEDIKKKEKRKKSTEMKEKSERKEIVKIIEEGDDSDKETNISPGYMGWQLDEDEGVSNDRKLLAYQKTINDIRDNHKHLEKEV